MMLLAGCQGPKPASTTSADPDSPAPTNPISNTDPCAERLHDACEPLLLYYAIHRRLPEKLEELRAVPGGNPSLSLVCPVSQKPYIYNRTGLRTADQGGVIIMYDPEPSHSGLRWAISITESGGSQPLITRVVAVPEARFIGVPPSTSDTSVLAR